MIQLDLFYQLAEVKEFDPLREAATRAAPYWTTSKRELVELCDTDPDFAREIADLIWRGEFMEVEHE